MHPEPIAVTKVVTPRAVSATFPQIPNPVINRPHIIAAIDTILEGPAQAVVIEGGEGIGKTILAAQFVDSHPERTFSVFVLGPSAFARSSEFLVSDLCDQVAAALRSPRPSAAEDPSVFLRKALVELNRHAITREEPHYFVVDGMLEGPPEFTASVSAILLELLPFGVRGFKFVFTGSAERLSADIQKGLIIKPFTPTGFSLDEARSYLSDVALDGQAFTEIHKAFRGVPGKLASVRRLLHAGTKLGDLADDLPTSFGELFEREWKAVQGCLPKEVEALGMLAHSRHNLTLDQIQQLCGLCKEDGEQMTKRLPFLTWTDPPLSISFVSHAFKRFAAGKLEDRRATSIDRVIDLLMSARTSVEAIEHLPDYLVDAGRSKEVISYLTADQLASVCENLQSLGPVRSAIDRGAKVARDLALPVEAFGFGLERALIAELEVASVLRSEVDARLEIEGVRSGLSLAMTAFLQEDRLELLGRVAQRQKLLGEYPDPAILDAIRSVAKAADFAGHPKRALAVAGDLICYAPDVAMTIVEKTAANEAGSSLDLALARLSALAADAEKIGEQAAGSHTAILERISSNNVRQLARAASVLTGAYSVDELLNQCESLASPEDSLFLLEGWCTQNQHSQEASKVVEYGLELILKATAYTPTARVVRRLCSPVPFLAADHPFEANRIIQKVDAQGDILRARGPAVEYVRLQLYLAEAESAWASQQATTRIEDLYLFIDSLTGSTRLEALSWCLRILTLDETERLNGHKLSLLSLFEEEFEKFLPQLLSGSAEHAEVLGGAAAALTPARPDLVKNMISSANTAERRDRLRQRFARYSFRLGKSLPDARAINAILDAFESRASEHACLSEIIDWLFSNAEATVQADWGQVLRRCLGIADAMIRHETVTKAYAIARRSPELHDEGLLRTLADQSEQSLRDIGSEWTQIDYGFATARILFQIDKEAAQSFYKSAMDLRKETNLPTAPAANAYVGCVKLAIRAFAGLIPQRLGTEEGLKRIRGLIGAVTSKGERARLWADLAARCFSLEAVDLGKEVTRDDLIPALDGVTDKTFADFVRTEAAPALFKFHPQVAYDEINKMSPEARDRALSEICTFLLLNQPPGDPWDSGAGVELDEAYPHAIDILACLEKMTTDYRIFTVISRLTSGLTHDSSALTKEQRAEVARQLDDLISRKFPSPSGVSHEGWKIAAAAHVSTLRNTNQAAWEALIANARQIPNLCDRVLVLGLIAEVLPARFVSLRAQVLNEARGLADKISSDMDRVGRLCSLADVASNFDPGVAKSLLSSAFSQSNDAYDGTEERQRRIVDLAYRIDPDFARSLISLLDNDPARARARDTLRRQLEIKDAKREVAKDEGAESRLAGLAPRDLAELCWSLLGGLNSGRIGHVRGESVIPYVQAASFKSLRYAYPVMAWAIQNSIERHANTPHGKTHLHHLFNATVFACDLAMRVITRAAGVQHTTSIHGRPITDAETAIVVGAGEREKALSFLRSWLDRHKPNYIKLCDPYFTVDDLRFLSIVREIVPATRVQVLTSEKKQRESGISEPFEESFRTYWRKQVSDQDPPDTDIVIVSLAGGRESPIHDRWIVSGSSGLRLGSSFSGLGETKITEISVLEPAVAVEREKEIDKFLTRQLRDVSGKRIKYSVFSL